MSVARGSRRRAYLDPFENPEKSNWIKHLSVSVFGVTVRRNFTFFTTNPNGIVKPIHEKSHARDPDPRRKRSTPGCGRHGPRQRRYNAPCPRTSSSSPTSRRRRSSSRPRRQRGRCFKVGYAWRAEICALGPLRFRLRDDKLKVVPICDNRRQSSSWHPLPACMEALEVNRGVLSLSAVAILQAAVPQSLAAKATTALSL